jgi:hypothetical protein
MPMPDHYTLTPEDMSYTRAAWLAFLAKLGVQPRIHPDTGDLHVDLDDFCSALNCTEEQLAAVFRVKKLHTGKLDDTVPLQ